MTNLHARRAGMLTAFIAALALISMFVLRASSAAFTAQTENTGNSFATTNVALDEPGTASFGLQSFVPGDSATRCFAVTYSGTETDSLSPVGFFATYDASAAAALVRELDVTVTLGANAVTCSGNVLSSATGSSSVFNGKMNAVPATSNATTWTPTATPQTRVFEVTVALPATSDNSVASQTVTNFDLFWDIQTIP